MTIKCYFDCTWTGPEATVDSKGKISNVDKADKREPPPINVDETAAVAD